MAQTAALKAAEAQLAYWRNEREAARRANDARRLAQCERFVLQCELVISALTTAGAAKRDR